MSITHFQTTTNSGGGVKVVDRSITKVNPGAALTVGVTWQSNGVLNPDGTASPVVEADEWLTPQSVGAGAPYTIEATLQSGSAPDVGPLNTQLALSSNRAWTWSVPAFTSDGGVLRFTIRRGSDVVGQCDHTFSGDATP